MTIKSRILRLNLNKYNKKIDFWYGELNEISKLKYFCRSINEDYVLNVIWWLEGYCNSKIEYLEFFKRILNDEFYESWCALERAEIILIQINKNKFVKELELLSLELASLIARWQSLFPYKVYISPEFIVKSRICSICKAKVNPWSACDHEVGNVYRGEICTHIVTNLEVQAMALVLDPVQKYSVVFPDGKDIYDYNAVKFVRDRLKSPWDKWSVNFTYAFHAHSEFDGTCSDDSCPCYSGRTYGECCMQKPGVLRPHAEIGFEVAPPAHLPNFYLPSKQR